MTRLISSPSIAVEIQTSPLGLVDQDFPDLHRFVLVDHLTRELDVESVCIVEEWGRSMIGYAGGQPI